MADVAQIWERLDRLRGSSVVVLGVGNTLKGDDAVGPQVCARLAGKVSATVIDAGTVPENYVQPIVRAAPDILLIVDAVDFGAAPGSLRVFDLEEIEAFALSTHALSLHLFIDLIRSEKEMTVVAVGVQPGHTSVGEPVSASVQESVDVLAGLLVQTFPLR
jgi:hydrogenase 3 maturation protease